VWETRKYGDALTVGKKEEEKKERSRKEAMSKRSHVEKKPRRNHKGATTAQKSMTEKYRPRGNMEVYMHN